MLSIEKALETVLANTCPLAPQTMPLSAHLLDAVLAEDVISDIDMPPFDKALMDGYAVRQADFAEGKAELTVIEEITAGKTPTKSVERGQATRIMTGAPMPQGADAVVMIERTQSLDGSRVLIEDRVKPRQNIMNRAQEMRIGETVVTRGTRLRPEELGILASVGHTQVSILPRPQVAVLSTGDEIVPADQKPGPGQIRNGSGVMLQAQIARAGGAPIGLGIALDTVESLSAGIQQGLTFDMLVLAGGVSAGKLDLVPSVLEKHGVKAHFHKVEMKPGKPLLFGTCGKTLVFGLPGNPVSSYVCFELFARPALRKLAGHSEPGPRILEARLEKDFPYRTDRPTYYPARLSLSAEGFRVTPIAWHGSADLRGILPAEAFVILPAGDLVHRAGTVLRVLAPN